jgi:hypothetical protein
MSYPFFFCCEKGIRALTIDKDNAPKGIPPPPPLHARSRVHVAYAGIVKVKSIWPLFLLLTLWRSGVILDK